MPPTRLIVRCAWATEVAMGAEACTCRCHRVSGLLWRPWAADAGSWPGMAVGGAWQRWVAMEVVMEAQVGAGRRRSQRRLGGDEGRMSGWSRRRVATEPSNGELRRRVTEEPGDGGHEGGTRPGDGGSQRRLGDGRNGRSKRGDEGRNVGFHDGGSQRSWSRQRVAKEAWQRP